MKFVMSMILMMGAYGTSVAFASELDREDSVVNAERELTGTTVLRVNETTGEISMLQSDRVLENEEEARALVGHGRFQAVGDAHHRTELDSDAGSSSWYFYYNPGYSYNYYSYYYYGRFHSPYYTFSYQNYSFYYYGTCNRSSWNQRRHHRGGRCW